VALAILEVDFEAPGDDGQAWFRFDIGSNRFYRFAIGGPERRRLDGVGLIDQPSFITPLQGPLPESAMGRGRFAIDGERFGRDAEFVQMMSYRTANREGPAVSSIVRAQRPLPQSRTRPAPGRTFEPRGLPAGGPPPPVLPARSLSRQAPRRAARPPMAGSLSFLDFLGAVAPAIGSLLGGLTGGAGGGARAPAGTAPAPPAGDLLARLADPATIRLLAQLVSQIGGVTAAPAAAAPAASGPSRAAALGYSNAMIAPALLAALPALMPLLQQVLNPQTIQTLVDAPNRAAQTVINGVNDVLKIGVQADAQFMDHLRQLNPGVDDPALDRMIEGLGLSRHKRHQPWHRTSRVRLSFDGLQSLAVAGEDRILFAHDRAIVLPMQVLLPKLKSGRPPRLVDAELELEVKDPVTLAVHQRATATLPPIIESGAVGAVTLPAEAVAGLEPGRDWLLSVSLTWRGPGAGKDAPNGPRPGEGFRDGGRPDRNGGGRGPQRIGAVMTTLVHLAGPLVYDGIVDEGEAVDLADPQAHRGVWHKLWAGRFAPEAKRFDAEIDYGYGWNAAARDTKRDDTSIRTKAAEGSVASMQARVRGGLVLTPDALHAAAASLDPSVPPLTDDERAALADSALAARLGLGARLRLKLRGREGEAFAVWAYPAVRRATVTLGAPSEILDTGNITVLEPRSLAFVVPVAINIVGTWAR